MTDSLNFGVTIPFVEHLGVRLHACHEGMSELRLQPRAEHLNSYHVVHGGVVMTLLDVTMAMAARSFDRSQGAVTVEMKTSFMQAARGPLRAVGRLMHRSATLAFTEATVFDAHDKPCAHASGTFKYMHRLPTGVRSVQPFRAS
ncbi:MAG: PaaI family thioesterase [Rhodoferax sp.]